MYDHIGLKVSDIDASVRFYQAALAPLGYVLCSRDESGAGFGPPGEPALWLYPEKGAKGRATHVAFRAPDRAAVDRFYAAALEAGGRDHGRPGLRADYSPTYYAAFLLDPDGNNVEAVCLRSLGSVVRPTTGPSPRPRPTLARLHPRPPSFSPAPTLARTSPPPRALPGPKPGRYDAPRERAT
jgi:catechol 2,3-dioxygenase-like lactoylglutathione lyase family enzyme